MARPRVCDEQPERPEDDDKGDEPGRERAASPHPPADEHDDGEQHDPPDLEVASEQATGGG